MDPHGFTMTTMNHRILWRFDLCVTARLQEPLTLAEEQEEQQVEATRVDPWWLMFNHGEWMVDDW